MPVRFTSFTVTREPVLPLLENQFAGFTAVGTNSNEDLLICAQNSVD
jgi:hypothetical protein